MIQKHCFECGTALIEKELEERALCLTARNPSQQPAAEFLNAYLDEVGNKPMEM